MELDEIHARFDAVLGSSGAICWLGQSGVASSSTDLTGAGLGRRKTWKRGGLGEEIG